MDLTVRPRRLRQTAKLRRMVRETALRPEQLIYPMFAVTGENVQEPISAMPGQYHLSIDPLLSTAAEAVARSVSAILLFGIPESKDETGSAAFAEDGIVQQALRALRDRFPDLVLITDVCLCHYTEHGHCGIVRDGQVHNDETLEVLQKVAVSHARAGADIVAPSDMMDGRVGAIRKALDQEGFTDTIILSYAAKFASSFYGPFREAAHSAPAFGDRRTYQMDPSNRREALREVKLDIDQGADAVMVKPALPYLDIIREVRDRFDVPLAAYQVSGEYAQIKAAAEKGWVDEREVMWESLTAMKRAGSDLIITYAAPDVAGWLTG